MKTEVQRREEWRAIRVVGVFLLSLVALAATTAFLMLGKLDQAMWALLVFIMCQINMLWDRISRG